MIPSGPYPPPTPNFTWLAWVIVGVIVVPLLIRAATRKRQAAVKAQQAARARARQRGRTR